MPLASSYIRGLGDSQDSSQALQESYEGTPVYSQPQTPSAPNTPTTPTTGAPAAGTPNTPAAPLGLPVNDYSQLPDWIRQNQRFTPTGKSMAETDAAHSAAVLGYRDLANKYGNAAVQAPWYLNDGKGDPRNQGLDPFGTYNSGYGFSGGKFYGQGSGYNPITGPSSQGMDFGNINTMSHESGTIGDSIQNRYQQAHPYAPQMSYDQFYSLFMNQTAGGPASGGAYPTWVDYGQQYGQDYNPNYGAQAYRAPTGPNPYDQPRALMRTPHGAQTIYPGQSPGGLPY